MLLRRYEELDTPSKIGLMDVANNAILYELLYAEIASVEYELCNLDYSEQLNIKYAIVQQRLICLKDLLEFMKQIQVDTTPQSNTE